MRLGAEGGAAEVCLSAADTVGRMFVTDPRRLRYDVIAKIAPRTTPKDAATVATAAIELAAQYRAANDLDTAAKLVATAGMLARKSRSAELIAETKKLAADQKSGEVAQKATAKLLEKLSQNPADPKVCREAGLHFCFERSDWDKGLPLLLKSDYTGLVAAARADVLSRQNKSAQLAAADAWAAWAATQRTRTVKSNAEQWAYEFYAAALETLQGLERTAVRKRMAGLGGGPGGGFAKSKTGPASIPGLVLWLDAADASFIVSGQKGRDEERVARWKDLSGECNDAAQPVIAKQPIFRGRFVEFDGNTCLALAAPISLNAMTLVVVYDPAADRPQKSAIASSVTADGTAGFQMDFEAHALNLGVLTGGLSEVNLGPQPATGPRLAIASISDTGVMTIHHRGGLDQSNEAKHASKAFNSSFPLHVCGTPGNWRGYSGLKGKLYRVMMYSRVLDQTERDALKAWSFGVSAS